MGGRDVGGEKKKKAGEEGRGGAYHFPVHYRYFLEQGAENDRSRYVVLHV